MFGDTLLESSSAPRKGKRWPMATAFTAEAIVGGLLVIVPLLSTGVIPVSARVPIYTPVKPVTLERVERVRTEPHIGFGAEQVRCRGQRLCSCSITIQSTIPDHPWAEPIRRTD